MLLNTSSLADQARVFRGPSWPRQDRARLPLSTTVVSKIVDAKAIHTTGTRRI